MWDLNQNRRQKVFTIGGFTFAQRDLTIWKFDEISTDYSVTYFNLEVLSEPSNAPRGDGSVLNFSYAVIIENVQNATITEASKTEQRTVNN